MLAAALIVIVFILAFANGANANFKGVASLYGSGTSSYQTCVNWAAITTTAGAACGMFLTAQLLKAFSGKGLVPDGLTTQPAFLLAVGTGAALTGGLATRLGFPVSTTHALTGGLTGAGLSAAPAAVNFARLWDGFALPLLLGPVIAAGLAFVVYPLLRRLKAAPDGHDATVDRLHFLSAGAVCFARGMNDTPKMAALLGVLGWFSGMQEMLLVAVAMTLGGLLGAARVADTLAHKITTMNPGQGFAANLTTAALVILGSVKGYPLSTTHVTVGSLLGIGIRTGQARWATASPVLLAWLITVPCAAALSAATWRVLT
jgi:inorganic phosphate transporter, PiT family